MSHAPERTPGPPGPIPVEWRNDVVAILRRQCHAIGVGNADDGSVTIGNRARSAWDSAFQLTTIPERNEALTNALLAYNVTGIHYDFPYGDAYDFMFTFRSQSLYGKIALITPTRRKIIICSIHFPDYGETII